MAIFGDVFTLVGIMVVLLTMDWRLALVAFSVLPIIVLVTQWFRRNVRETYRNVRIWIARINAYLQEHIIGMSIEQLYVQEQRSFERFDEINATHRNANLDSILYYAVFYPAIEVTSALASSLIIWFGGGWVLSDSLTLGSLVAFLLYAQRFFRPISDMSEKFNVLQAAMASSERIFKLLDTPVVIENPSRPVPPAGESDGRIVFDHVSFAYNGTDEVLHDVSFEIEPGQRVGVVGATGAGKTTLINLLLRFYDVTSGRILVDGVDVREMDLTDLRGRFSLVSSSDCQVAWTRRSASGARDCQWGRSSCCRSRERSPSTRRSSCSTRRPRASTPTPSCSSEMPCRLMEGRTTVAIAHRLSTIQDMDTILVLHKGSLREVGNHQELLAQRGIYYRLYELQYKEQGGGEPCRGAGGLPGDAVALRAALS